MDGMDVDQDLQSRLQAAAAVQSQNERMETYLNLLAELLRSPHLSSLVAFGRHFSASAYVGVVERRVFGALVLALCAGSDLGEAHTKLAYDPDMEDTSRWEQLGREAFAGEEGEERREKIVTEVLGGEPAPAWGDQVTVLRRLQSHILQRQEDWLGAARALMAIPLEGNTRRMVSDEEKLAVYIEIVRLLLECGESGQAQTYFSRASLLIHTTTDPVTKLHYRLSQARLFDYAAKFNEAAQRYHELSFDSSIAEEDRIQMLQSAVMTSILAPAGPQRSRILAALNRDDRIDTSLPPYLPSMLRKMLLEYIVRPEEVKEFEAGLAEHQRATVEGGGTVLERAVREHNVGACGKVYDNISFEALGAILNLDPEAAEVTARKMIEQGRLRAWIDQPLHLLYFESRPANDIDADAQGTAGGLGIEREEKPIEPVRWTERWDDRIRAISMKVESLATAIQASEQQKAQAAA